MTSGEVLPSVGKKKIVVIEDDTDFLVLVRMMLADEALEIIPALGGVEGLETVRALAPDLVLLDLILPDLNGWEVYVQMREDPALANIPVIILTCQGTRYDRTFGLHVARVHDYLMKPFLPSQLRRSVTSALRV
jgi:DNA-binding response OmpR family regulator